MAQQIRDRLPQAGVRFGFLLCQLCFQPAMQFLHDRSAVLLMKGQSLRGREPTLTSLRVVTIHATELLQHMPALSGEVRQNIDELPSAMPQAIRQEEFYTRGQL